MAKGKTKDEYAETYTHPELRERLKEEIKASGKGGRAGQWSARKSQLLVREYEAAGGGYRHEGELTESQQHLHEWSEQDWHTKDGEAGARGEGGTARYLPDAAWKLLTDAEREATDRRKREGEDQHVDNTEAAREARRAAELLDLGADAARAAVRRMDTRSGLERARRAEGELGKGRKTVLGAIDRRLEAL
ncbi:MAG: hypothetical protein AVDCRST_MAG13-3981 [uncultured Solirubrobacteraceae bacterium]|uniref:DUF5872 domain-containing protein n=1 Tax=uncultured Solirubrobacteraceae bacterium TaxID=1162706 RepID=A0A6J4TRY9_9ACTN|nr:MAG: hypothetical protein AVDCRST_MAG13-3981 [uncultured Solirubrobacteraceae bacterium]